MWNGASDKCAKEELRRCFSDNGATDMEAMAVDPGVDVTESRTILVVPMTSAALAFEMAGDHDHVVCGCVFVIFMLNHLTRLWSKFVCTCLCPL